MMLGQKPALVLWFVCISLPQINLFTCSAPPAASSSSASSQTPWQNGVELKMGMRLREFSAHFCLAVAYLTLIGQVSVAQL